MPAGDKMVRKLAKRGGDALQRYERFMKMGVCTRDMAMSERASGSSLLAVLLEILTKLDPDVYVNVTVTVR